MAYPLSYTKARYREIFRMAEHALSDRLMALRGQFACVQCAEPPEAYTAALHEGCGFRDWQRACIEVVSHDIGREIVEALGNIQSQKSRYQCHMCGVCCRMASSEHSFEELQQRAADGDAFARQFTSIFLPYPSLEAARQRMPAVVGAVEAEQEGKIVHFYHCPYVGEDNRCSIFNSPKRPDICSQYPDTPLTYMYDQCAWAPWKAEYHGQTLLAHAMIELCQHTQSRLEAALS